MALDTRSFHEKDQQAVINLYKRVFSQGLTRKKWLWKMLKNPNGKPIIHLLLDNDRIVGQYAAIPIRLKFFHQSVYAYQVVDSMIDPAYRQGLGKVRGFMRVAKSAFSEFTKNQIPITYGFPNNMARDFGKQILHYEDILELQKFIYPLRDRAFIEERCSDYSSVKQLGTYVYLSTHRIYHVWHTLNQAWRKSPVNAHIIKSFLNLSVKDGNGLLRAIQFLFTVMPPI